MSPITDLLFASAFAVACLPAQVPAPPASLLEASTLLVPLHSHRDDPVLGAYGLWAAGPDYKASFHDGFTFYPRLGPTQPDNLPLRWQTESIRVGEQVLVDGHSEPAGWHDAWRCELRYHGVTEAYDVRRDGVEQTFVFAAPPRIHGDLVVTGRVRTPLHVLPVVSAMADLVFVDESGQPRVRYGAATAVDALGQRTPVPTSFDGTHIRLTIDGTWLARAQFPVVLDPLTAPVSIHSDPTSLGVYDIAVGFESESSQFNVMVVFSRASSSTDFDVFGLLMHRDFSPGLLRDRAQ